MYFAATVPGTCVITAHERLEPLVLGGGRGQVAGVHGVDHRAIRSCGDVRGDADEAGRTDREVRQRVRVVTGEVHQIGLVEHTAHLGEVALGVLHGEDVRVLGEAQDRLVLDRHTGAARDVVEDHGKIRGVGDETEVCEDSGLGRLVVVRRDDHDAVGTGLLAGLVELDRMGGLVRPTTGDDLGPTCCDGFADLDQLELLRVGQGGGLAGRSRHDDAVRACGDHVIDVLLDGGPIDFTVGRHRSDERDENLSEWVARVRHAPSVSPRMPLTRTQQRG